MNLELGRLSGRVVSSKAASLESRESFCFFLFLYSASALSQLSRLNIPFINIYTRYICHCITINSYSKYIYYIYNFECSSLYITHTIVRCRAIHLTTQYTFVAAFHVHLID